MATLPQDEKGFSSLISEIEHVFFSLNEQNVTNVSFYQEKYISITFLTFYMNLLLLFSLLLVIRTAA